MSFRSHPLAAACAFVAVFAGTAHVACAESGAAGKSAHAARNDRVRAPQAQAKSQAQSTPAASAGMRIYLDPNTGERLELPVTAQHKAIADQLPLRDDAKMKQVDIPGVGVLMHTQGQMQMTSVVRRGADGALHEDCLPSAAPQIDTAAGRTP